MSRWDHQPPPWLPAVTCLHWRGVPVRTGEAYGAPPSALERAHTACPHGSRPRLPARYRATPQGGAFQSPREATTQAWKTNRTRLGRGDPPTIVEPGQQARRKSGFLTRGAGWGE